MFRETAEKVKVNRKLVEVTTEDLKQVSRARDTTVVLQRCAPSHCFVVLLTLDSILIPS